MKTIATNKRARFDYEIIDTFEAGIELTGAEVKSIKAGHVSLKGSHAAIVKSGPILLNMHVRAYQPAGKQPDYDPVRTRKLLLHKKEIDHLRGKSQEQGLTIFPIRVYTKRGLIKVELGLGRGKKKYDKREVIKKREEERKMRRILKN